VQVAFDGRDSSPVGALIALAPVGPRIETVQRGSERTHLAQVAATVGIALKKITLGVPRERFVRLGAQAANIGQTQALLQHVAVGERFREEVSGIDKQHRDGAVNGGSGSEQYGGFRTERRNDRKAARIDSACPYIG